MAQWQVEDVSPEASPKHEVLRPISQEKQRTGTGRFHPEELTCFKRVPTPTRPHRLEQDAARRSRGDSNLSGRPPSRDGGDSQSLDGTPTRLPQEDSTARVLDLIYPRSTGAFVDRVTEQPDAKQRLERLDVQRRAKKPQPTPVGSAVDAAQQALQRPQTGISGRFIQFRRRMVDKFLTVKNAFDTFTHENSSALRKELSRKDFRRFLNRHFHGLSSEEQDNIFEYLDHNRNGFISLAEFHTSIEAAQPVRNMEDLRRKLIAFGHTSMRQAIIAMDARYEQEKMSSSKRLGLPEFAAALSRVGITDDEEHQAIFNLVSEPNEANTVSLDELHSSIAAVSPSLLLEDIRDRLVKKFGSLNTAYSKIDLDDNSILTAQEFVRHCVRNLKMTNHEAMKAFCIMDVDGNGWISRCEFLSALRLSEPSLFLEDLRKKVRQRFRSIRDAVGADDSQESSQWTNRLTTVEHDMEEEGQISQGSKAFTPNRRQKHKDKDPQAKNASALHLFLSAVGFSESDTKMLFDLVDIDREGKLTPLEFVRGIKLFAPSVYLEDLRLQCLKNCSRCRDAFKPHRNREATKAIMDLKGFKRLLQELKLDTGVNVEGVFYIVESRKDGGLALGELFAALHSGAPGVQIALPPDQRDAKARQQVKWQMAPFHRNAGDLRSKVRQKPDGDMEPPRMLPMGFVHDPRSYVTSSSLHQKRMSRSSPDLKLRGASASDGFLNPALGSTFSITSALHGTAPPGIGFGLSTLGAAGQLQSTSTGVSPLKDGLGRSTAEGSLSMPNLRDPLGVASPRSPSSPSSFAQVGDSLLTPTSTKKAPAMETDLGGQSPARFVGQSPARRQRSPSPRTPLKKRDSFMHVPTKQSYKKISSLVNNCDASFDRKPMLDRLHGYYLTAGQTIATDLSLTAELFSRAKNHQVASCHHAALARNV